jgi:hypothetical protein
MHVLIIGGKGFVGRIALGAFMQQASRSPPPRETPRAPSLCCQPCEWYAAALPAKSKREGCRASLKIDAVVNCAGLIRDGSPSRSAHYD